MKKSNLIILIIVCVVGYLIIFSIIFNRFRTTLPTSNAIGLIEVEGPIIDSKDIVRQIKSYTKNPFIKGILIRIESPGGGVSASQEIYSEIKSAKSKGKKVVVSMGSIAASGGYYIACPADIIVANPGTITGSIGVIMEFPIFTELMKKLGIKFEIIKSREHKDIGSPFREMTDKERKLLNETTADVYNQFIDVIVENRKIPKEKVLEIADGRIFSGKQAQSLGLVDSLGTYEDAKRILANLCDIKKEPKIIKERPKFSLIRKLLSRSFNWLFSSIPLYLYTTD
ncbi:MAG: signal peptide peptidase SppA [candidate division WOR-3 bacterium]